MDDLRVRAAELGIERPLAGPFLRQVWGRCVFLGSDGCRLHAAHGPGAKPRVCRTFPALPGGEVDPACFHPGEIAPARGPAWAELGELAHGERVAARLERLPLAAILEGPDLGPTTAALLRPLIDVRPAIPSAGDRELLAARVEVAARHGLVPGPRPLADLAGGAQLAAGARVALEPTFAAWTRLLRTGVLAQA